LKKELSSKEIHSNVNPLKQKILHQASSRSETSLMLPRHSITQYPYDSDVMTPHWPQ